MTSMIKLLKNVPTKAMVIAELKRIHAIKWFKPLELNKNVKKAAEEHVAEALKLFNIKEKYKVGYRKLSSLADWGSAAGEAHNSARWEEFHAAEKAAEAVINASSMIAIWENMPAADKGGVIQFSVNETAKEIAGAEISVLGAAGIASAPHAAEGDIACVFVSDQGVKNPFAHLISLWEMGFWPIGPCIGETRTEFVLYYVPKK